MTTTEITREEILENRQKAITALREGDEKNRISGTLVDRRGKVCALGQIGIALGLWTNDPDSLAGMLGFQELGIALGNHGVCPFVYQMNDPFTASKTRLGKVKIKYSYSWKQIANALERRWASE